jgi:hypothetical protein
MPIEIRSPCDVSKLASSPDLPKSIYDPGDEIFDLKDADRLVAEALSMSDQPPFTLSHLPPPVWRYGLSMSRFNRIEGFSTGLAVSQGLGAGLELGGALRVATADHRPRWEASVLRSNVTHSIQLGGYDRLLTVSDVDQPLTFGASLSALLYGRDDAFYYKARGGELIWTRADLPRVELRLFAEKQSTAVVGTDTHISGTFLPNIFAMPGTYRGAGLRWTTSHGLDPRALRVATELRLEAANGPVNYERGALDDIAEHPITSKLDGSLTLSGGSSVGELPPQRHWFLGGIQTVRGERPDTARGGDAFWLARGEVGRTLHWFRPTLFGDIGWAGDRSRLSEVGRPTSGAGIGFSFLDGALRLDIARGIYPQKKTLVSFYIGARF